MKNWERFKDGREAEVAFIAECGGAVIRCNWLGIIDWLYMDYIEGEGRLEFLMRARHLTGAGMKERNKLARSAGRALEAAWGGNAR